jgi:hypothetical protein
VWPWTTRTSVRAGSLDDGVPAHSLPQHLDNRSIALGVLGSASISTFTLGPLDPFSLTPPPVLVILASDGGEHVQHHGIESVEHAAGELIAGLRHDP